MDLPAPPDPLPRPVVDTHCHLDATQELSGLEPADALARAAAVGVPRVVQVGCDVAGSRWAIDAAEQFSSVVAAVAIHPNDAARLGPDLDEALREIEALARHVASPASRRWDGMIEASYGDAMALIMNEMGASVARILGETRL